MKNRIANLGVFMVLLSLLGGCAAKDREATSKEARLRYEVAQQLLQNGELTQGLSELLKAEELDPNNPEIHHLLGLVYAQRKKYDSATKHLHKATSLAPDFSEAYNDHCAILIQEMKYKEAIVECEKAVKNITYATPERPYHNMGFAYEKLGDSEKAMESYRSALIHNKNFVLSRKALGNMYFQNGKYKEALGHYDVAAEACSKAGKGSWGDQCPESYYQQAMTLLKLKRKVKAVEALKTCVEADDENGAYSRKCRSNLKLLQ